MVHLRASLTNFTMKSDCFGAICEFSDVLTFRDGWDVWFYKILVLMIGDRARAEIFSHVKKCRDIQETILTSAKEKCFSRTKP
jgi:hypothetical protein